MTRASYRYKARDIDRSQAKPSQAKPKSLILKEVIQELNVLNDHKQAFSRNLIHGQ
jgi:hypothetical protein